MNANAILIAYMIENDTRPGLANLPLRLAQVPDYKADVYFSTLVAAALYLTLAML